MLKDRKREEWWKGLPDVSFELVKDCELPPHKSIAMDQGFAKMIHKLGEAGFEDSFAKFFNDACGSEHVYLFSFAHDRPRMWAALSCDGSNRANSVGEIYEREEWWRYDRAMQEAGNCLPKKTKFLKTDIKLSDSTELRNAMYDQMNMCDRLMFCGRFKENIVGFCILRSGNRGPFQEDEVRTFESTYEFSLPLLVKHFGILTTDFKISDSISGIDEIENSIKLSNFYLSPRECQVASRYIYGLSTVGVSSDLCISEETVNTHRKNIYEKLNISSTRDLLIWYINKYEILHKKRLSEKFEINLSQFETYIY